MPRPQTPLAKAALTGADKKDPQRYRDRSNPKASGRSIGKAPDYLSKNAKKAWAIFVDEIPWLVYEDRAALEIVSIMRGQIIEGASDLPASFFGNYRMAVSSLGATPVDRSKVHQPHEEADDDPFAEFDSRQH